MFITNTKKVLSITDEFILLQSGSVFYSGLTVVQYKHRVIFTSDDRITKDSVFVFPINSVGQRFSLDKSVIVFLEAESNVPGKTDS